MLVGLSDVVKECVDSVVLGIDNGEELVDHFVMLLCLDDCWWLCRDY